MLADFVDLLVVLVTDSAANMNILTVFFLLIFLVILNFSRICFFIFTFEIGSKLSIKIINYYRDKPYSPNQVIFLDE
jgi:hypothetical protein